MLIDCPINGLPNSNGRDIDEMKPKEFQNLMLDAELYAVIRIDDFQTDDESRFTVKEIVLSEEEAVSEVDRLNQLNSPKGCRYFWQYTRLRKGTK